MPIFKMLSIYIDHVHPLLHDQPMERVSNYKYLGVLISDDLSWSPHIDKITSKARRLL